MVRSHLTVARALVAVASIASVAHADAPNKDADALFRKGRDLMAAGKLAEACAAFEQSEHLDANTSTLLNLAGCREKLGQLATAWQLFTDAERKTATATDATTRQLHDVARDKAAKLEPRVSKLTIDVAPASRIDGLEVVRGQDRVDPADWNHAVPIDGGSYTITARAPGATEWSSTLTIAAEGDRKTVEVPSLARTAKPVPPPVPVPVPEPTPEPAPESPHASVRVPIALGVGALALLGGAVGFELSGSSTYDQAKAEMTDQARRDSLESSADNKRYAAEGLAVAGVGCAAAAIWLYVHGRGGGERAAVARAHSTHLVPTATGFAIAGSY